MKGNVKLVDVLISAAVPRGLMDMASDYESGDSGFESRRGSFKLPVRELFLKCYRRCIITMYL